MSDLIDLLSHDYYEASARDRVLGVLDAGSFREFVGPETRTISPHLALFGLTGAFDDGMVIGEGLLGGKRVYVAAQEGRFMGGAFGEVHGAKLVGLLRAARDNAAKGVAAVLILLDTGGVRLQEANAGELAIAETLHAIAAARRAGVPVLALVGGRSGAFGGGGIVTAFCSRIIVSEHGRIGVSGPEVIETNKGVEEFDSKDKGLVWRVTGGRTRAMMGGADRFVRDRIADFRAAAIEEIGAAAPFDLATLRAEQARLAARLSAYGSCRDAPEIWHKAGLAEPAAIATVNEEAFTALPRLKEAGHDAR
ncbi:biotin-independent malonate decarboxylase subunit beta [Segnochrobactrum spirostomi]|uniref:Biotin-independent malonate decarboxylase subunit beta n=1 Tax=Segnochrobactrum spirostomi TaxID=2608987 RepID=A0A6A7Y9Y7_9HYPH|nr:biotin-independent malonate decarboxylase subunit beta [Segnochrobactrum spirostomi]MQT14828.1 biotin-independent malonate decarboxylase subunit beta [Segnochrobactrum spirostomi]